MNDFGKQKIAVDFLIRKGIASMESPEQIIQRAAEAVKNCELAKLEAECLATRMTLKQLGI